MSKDLDNFIYILKEELNNYQYKSYLRLGECQYFKSKAVFGNFLMFEIQSHDKKWINKYRKENYLNNLFIRLFKDNYKNLDWLKKTIKVLDIKKNNKTKCIAFYIVLNNTIYSFTFYKKRFVTNNHVYNYVYDYYFKKSA